MKWLAVLFACGHASSPPPSNTSIEPPGTGPARDRGAHASCEEIADHVWKLSHGEAPPDLIDRYRVLMSRRCREDLWSLEVRRCYADLTTIDTSDACEAKLVPEQRLRRPRKHVDKSLRLP